MRLVYAKSTLSQDELVGILIENESFQLVDPYFLASEKQAELALYCAKHNSWLAKSLKNEFLLWLAGEHEVRKAIGKAGIKSNVFVLVIFEENEKIERILKKLKAKKLSENEIEKIKAAAMEKWAAVGGEKELLELIATSRIYL